MTIISLIGDENEYPPLQPNEYSQNLQELKEQLRRSFSENIPAINDALNFQQNPELSKLFEEVKKVLEKDNFDDFSVQKIQDVAKQFAEQEIISQQERDRIFALSQNNVTQNQPIPGVNFE